VSPAIRVLIWIGLFGKGITAGQHLDLTDSLQLDRASGQFAQLYIPDHVNLSQSSEVDLVFHFHGVSRTAENAVVNTGIPAILFNIHLAGFSSVYRRYFEIPGRFEQIINSIKGELRESHQAPDIRIRYLILTSFSAGYGGVRELLKFPELYRDIDALLLADGLHSDSDPQLMAEQMQDFVRFASDAGQGKKVMVLTHSRIEPEGYESTTSTADYLIGKLGLGRHFVEQTDSIGQQYTYSDTGYFHVSGYLGQTGRDHMRHLHYMDLRLKILMIDLQEADLKSQ
jgi:hypothetical protein